MKEKNENSPLNEGHNKFGLPEGYFQKSASAIFDKIAWEEEHKEFQTLLKLKGTNGFRIPENYFTECENRLERLGYPVLGKVSKNNPFKVPEDYFVNLRSTLEIDNELPGHLAKLRSHNVFGVPQGYFENQEIRFKQSLQSGEAKVVSLFAKRLGFAIAALLIVVLGVWLYSFYATSPAVEDCGTIACLDKKDLTKTRNLENMDDDELYELVDPAALEKKLSSPDKKNPAIKKNDQQKDSSLKDISDDELLEDI